MHFLPFKHIYQLHLFLESLHKLVPLSFESSILFDKPVHVLPKLVTLASLGHFGISQLCFVLLKLFYRAVKLGIPCSLVLCGSPLFSLTCVQLFALLG
jgi:hypothetical protein